MMKAYLSGKITGDLGYKEKFAAAAELVRSMGFEPLNPANAQSGLTNRIYMRMAFAMIDEADFVFLLPDWGESEGSKIEKAYADYTGIPTDELVAVIEAERAAHGNERYFSLRQQFWWDTVLWATPPKPAAAGFISR